MFAVIYGNSETGDVDTEYANHVGITYTTIRDEDDHNLAVYDIEASRWVRAIDGTLWTDIDVEVALAEGQA